MAKRVPPDEQPFRPVSESIVRSVLSHQRESHQKETDDKIETAENNQSIGEKEANNRPERVEEKPLEKRNREKRFLLSLSEERRLETLAISLSAELGTSVKSSHIIRACLSMLLDREDKIREGAEKSRGLSRPANGDLKAINEFENAIGKLLKKALR